MQCGIVCVIVFFFLGLEITVVFQFIELETDLDCDI